MSSKAAASRAFFVNWPDFRAQSLFLGGKDPKKFIQELPYRLSNKFRGRKRLRQYPYIKINYAQDDKSPKSNKIEFRSEKYFLRLGVKSGLGRFFLFCYSLICLYDLNRKIYMQPYKTNEVNNRNWTCWLP